MEKPDGWNDILQLVSSELGVPAESFFVKTRKKDTVLARRIFYILCKRSICRNMNQQSFIDLMGTGWTDRSILSYYEKCHLNDMQVDKNYRRTFKKLTNEAKLIKLEFTKQD